MEPTEVSGKTLTAEQKDIIKRFEAQAKESLEIMFDISQRSGEGVFLDALEEECAELIHAASKYRRAKGWSKSPTPMSVNDAFSNLLEEIRDVQMMIDAVFICVLKRNPEEQLDNTMELYKWRRWIGRLENKGESD